MRGRLGAGGLGRGGMQCRALQGAGFGFCVWAVGRGCCEGIGVGAGLEREKDAQARAADLSVELVEKARMAVLSLGRVCLKIAMPR